MRQYYIREGAEMRDINTAEKKYWNIRVDFGLFLFVMGIPIGRIIFEFLKIDQSKSSFSFSNIFMVLGILLVIDYDNLLKCRLPRLKKYTLCYVAFVIYILFSLAFSARAEQTNYMHMFFSIAEIVAISTQDENLTSKYFIPIIFYCGFIYVFYCAILSTNSFTDFHFYSVQAFKYGTSKMSTTRGVLYVLTAMLVYDEKKGYIKLIKLIAVLCAVFTFLTVRVRTVFVSLFLTVMVYFFLKGKSKKQDKKKVMREIVSIGVVLIIVVGVMQSIPSMGNKIIASINTTISAMNTFLGRGGDDYSAGVRVGIRQWISSYYSENLNLFTGIFGFGYVKYLDMPVVQAFFDFGIFGFFYLYYMILKPMSFIKRRKYTAFQTYIILFMVQNIVDQIAYMIPYESQFHVRVVLMLQILMIELKQERIYKLEECK